MNEQKITILLVIIGVLLASLSQFIFTVDETQRAMIIRFGKPSRVDIQPGLHFRLPSFIDKVLYFDIRIKDYDADAKDITTKDKKMLKIDNYSKWRISNLLTFYRKVRTVELAISKIDDIIYSVLRNVCGNYKMIDIVNTKRDEILEKVLKECRKNGKDLGIEIVDVRIKRADLPRENENAVYERMQTERVQQAKKYRSTGRKMELIKKAMADRLKIELLASAKRDAEILKGEGEAATIEILAEAYGKDLDFYKFYKSLEIMRTRFKKNINIYSSSDVEFLDVFFKR
ncbi:protease modulator HflC [bacterium]|nr:protease modulator HflC [bacterium]